MSDSLSACGGDACGGGGDAELQACDTTASQRGEQPRATTGVVALACVRSPPIVVDARKRSNRERPRANEHDVCLAKRHEVPSGGLPG